MTSYEEVKNLYESNNKLELFEKKVKESCNVIMRQTDYDYAILIFHEKYHNHNQFVS